VGKREYGEEWIATLPEDGVQALRTYKGDEGYTALNAYLRFGEVTPGHTAEELQAIAASMRAALRRKPLPEAVITYRGVAFEAVFGDADIGDLIGAQFAELGFISTSLVREIAENWDRDLFVIAVPRGTPAAWLEELHYLGESELLLSAGAELAIVGYERRDGRRILYLEAVGEMTNADDTTNTTS
jgi:hypothetical protein